VKIHVFIGQEKGEKTAMYESGIGDERIDFCCRQPAAKRYRNQVEA
jgi:hypothetical protein